MTKDDAPVTSSPVFRQLGEVNQCVGRSDLFNSHTRSSTALTLPTTMKSSPPLKTYVQCRKARPALMSARMEEMERAIRVVTSKQRVQYARDFPTIQSAIEAVEEVSIDFLCSLLSKGQSNLYQCCREIDSEISSLSVTPLQAGLCVHTDVVFFQRFQKVTRISAISAICFLLVHSCMSMLLLKRATF